MARKGRGKAKGGAYEREICRTLSLWWSDGEDGDVFYKTAGSGNRATARTRAGKDTSFGYGDVQAINPIGQPLMDVSVIELKKGYNKETLIDCLDRPPQSAHKVWEKWIRQAEEEEAGAGSVGWMLISRRDQRQDLLTMSEGLYEELLRCGACTKEFIGSACATIPIRSESYFEENLVTVFVTPLQNFLDLVSPSVIKKAAKRKKQRLKDAKTRRGVEEATESKMWRKQR